MKLLKILSIISIFTLINSCSETKVDQTTNNEKVLIETSKASVSNENGSISISGTVQAVNKANISTRMMGTIKQINVNIGDLVKKGEILLTIDGQDITAQLAQAKANLLTAESNFKNTETNFKRFKSLHEKKSATQKEFDDISTQYEMSKAQLEMAKEAINQVKAQFQYTNITAPFSGTITSKTVNVGDLANPGMPLLGIESTNDFEVIGMISESNISSVKANQLVSIEIPSIRKTIQGRIKELSASGVNSGGQYQVSIQLLKKPNELLAGMYAKIHLAANTVENNAIYINKKALVHKGQLTGLYTVSESGTALLRWIRTGNQIGDKVEVVSGLSANETYIIAAEGKLFNGAQITIKE